MTIGLPTIATSIEHISQAIAPVASVRVEDISRELATSQGIIAGLEQVKLPIVAASLLPRGDIFPLHTISASVLEALQPVRNAPLGSELSQIPIARAASPSFPLSSSSYAISAVSSGEEIVSLF
jgi:hypothetical protein